MKIKKRTTLGRQNMNLKDGFLVRSVETIRRDPALKGWAIGDFYDPTEVPFTNAFEVKEWDEQGVQTAWKMHRSGPEYISVKLGVLVVEMRDPESGAQTVENVAAGQCIVLSPEVERRYRAGTERVEGVTVRIRDQK